MPISRIKQIKRILAHGDVRDPRASLIAIEEVLSQPKAKEDAPLIKVVGRRSSDGSFGLSIDTDGSITPIELFGVIKSLRRHGDQIFGDVVIKREVPTTSDLSELFKQFEQDILKTTGVPGNSDEVTK